MTVGRTDSATEWTPKAIDFIQQVQSLGGKVVLRAELTTLTPQKFADELGLSRSTVMRRIQRGDIKVSRKGNRYVIPETEVESFRNLYVRELARSLADDF